MRLNSLELNLRGAVAQLAAQRTFNPSVVGSSPTGPARHSDQHRDQRSAASQSSVRRFEQFNRVTGGVVEHDLRSTRSLHDVVAE